MSFERLIQYIKDGEPVSAGTPNRPLSQLDQNIRYLWDVLQAASVGSTVFARQQTVASTVLVGQPVYFDSVNSRFDAAYATAESDPTTGYLYMPEASQVWGIVSFKHNSTLADILLFGHSKIDITNAVAGDVLDDGSVPAGTWYLSGTSDGILTREVPPVSIPVLKTDASGYVFVNPSFVDFLENHRHYMFELETDPAGLVSPPTVGDPHSITSPDADIPGWLPASHAVFEGKAPAGAKFGYNLSQHESLRNAFPPIPAQSASIVMQRPSVWDTDEAHRQHGQQLMSDTVVIDRNGIWWMTDCYDQVPWDTLLDSTGSASADPDACAASNASYSLKLYFTKVGFATDTATVRSLRSRDERLVITCAGTDTPGYAGDLEIDLDLSWFIGDQDVPGYVVAKSLNTTTNTFEFGPVAEGVYATSSNVLLTSPHTTTVDGVTHYHGPVGIGVLSQASRELSSQLVRLDGVTEENYPVLYLGMANVQTTSYVVKFEVPADAPSGSQLRLRSRILGRTAGTLPQLTTTYYKTARPSAGLLTPVSVTQSYSALTMTTVASVSANQAVEATSDAVNVSPGDIVYFRVQRTPSDVSDTYAGELGIMQQVGVLTSV